MPSAATKDSRDSTCRTSQCLAIRFLSDIYAFQDNILLEMQEDTRPQRHAALSNCPTGEII